MAWTIDTAHTTVGFNARHMGLAKVRGQFDSFDGTISGDPSNIEAVEGRFEVDLASVDTGNADRDAHLRSADFFDIEKHPKMTFVSKSVTANGNGTYAVRGELTIRGIAKEVELQYEHGGEGQDPYGNRKVGGTLSGTIKRSDWGLTWNVALETGGWLVSDKINVEIDLQVAESKEAIELESKAEAATSA